MFEKVVLFFLLALTLLNLPENICADEGKIIQKANKFVVEINQDVLARRIFPSCVPFPVSPFYRHPGIVKKYKDQYKGKEFELVTGIYPDEIKASTALNRTLTEVARLIIKKIGDEHFFSTYALHLRFRNLVVLLILNNQLSDDSWRLIANSMEKALQDPTVMKMGSSLNIPKINILEVDKKIKPTKVVYSFDNDNKVLIEKQLKSRSRKLADGLIESRIEKYFFDKEETLRIARITGEIAELPISEFPPSVLEVSIPLKKEKEGIKTTERENIMSKLRDKKGDPKEQSVLLLRLSQHPTEDMIPFFREILASNKGGPIKKFALEGFAKLKGKNGLKEYHLYAADKEQSDLIRRNAIQLIGKYGSFEDLAFLEDIAKEENEWLAEALAEAIRRLKSKP